MRGRTGAACRHVAAAGLLAAMLSGCMSLPEFHVDSEQIKGALVSTGGKLYLLGSRRSTMFDSASFMAYRELMDSLLKDAVAFLGPDHWK